MEATIEHGLYYGGAWHAPVSGTFLPSINPADGSLIGQVPQAGKEDVDRAVLAAVDASRLWRDVSPLERARLLREMAAIIRQNHAELARLDALDCGNPVRELIGDAQVAAALIDYFAGLVTEMKGASIPVGPDAVNFSVRQPFGVVARILAFNHPFLFCAGKIAAPLAAGNAVIVKPSDQAPLSALRFAELIDGLLPAGTFGVLTGGAETGAALASHPKVGMISLVGSAARTRRKERTDRLSGCGPRRSGSGACARNEFRMVRSIVRFDEPGVRPRGYLRRRSGACRSGCRALSTGRSPRFRDVDGSRNQSDSA
jgi:betaine-aldehyde dehydrogenase